MITALMAAKNAAKTIEASLHGLFVQSRPADEVIVVDDASTDDTPRILLQYKRRLRIITKEKSEGFAAALNTGLAAIDPRSRYIAINDADDISHPHRFKLQARHLDLWSSDGVVGSGYKTFGHCWYRRYHVPTSHEGIMAAIERQDVYMPHSSFMVRAAAMPGYDTRFRKACDCHLLVKLVACGWRLAAHFLALWDCV